MINVLLATLMEVLDIQHDHATGNADSVAVLEAKKRFAHALYELIDNRVQIALDLRRRHLSQERIAVADSINANLKSTASTIKSISALNSAPPPPKNPNDTKAMEMWLKAYDEWYNVRRTAGITIE